MGVQGWARKVCTNGVASGMHVPGYNNEGPVQVSRIQISRESSKLISVNVLVVFSTQLVTTSGDVEHQLDEREPVNSDNIDGRYAYRRAYCSGYQACHLQAWKDVTAQHLWWNPDAATLADPLNSTVFSDREMKRVPLILIQQHYTSFFSQSTGIGGCTFTKRSLPTKRRDLHLHTQLNSLTKIIYGGIYMCMGNKCFGRLKKTA